MKRLLILLGFAALLGACPGKGDKRRPSSEPPLTEIWLWHDQVMAAKLVVEPLAPQPVGGLVLTSGRVTFDDLKVAHVMSPVTGRVIRIEAQPGQRVKKGDTLAVIESPDVGSAFSDLEKAHADFISADKDFKRQKELFDVHAGSQRDLETAQGNLRQEQGRASSGQAEGAASERRRCQRGQPELHPARAHRRRGHRAQRESRRGGAGTIHRGHALELFTIGELDTVWVMADVFEMDLGRVKQGTACMVQGGGLSRTHLQGHRGLGLRHRSIRPRARPRFAASWTTPIGTSSPRCTPPQPWPSIGNGRWRFRAARSCTLGDQTMVFVEMGKAPDGTDCASSAGRCRSTRKWAATTCPVIRGIAAGERVVTSGAILLSGMF